MDRTVLIFASAAALLGTVFFVSLIELLYTIHRRKATVRLNDQIKDLRSYYNQSINKLVVDGDAQLETIDSKLNETQANVENEKKILEDAFEKRIQALTEKSEKQLEAAKAKAKRLEEEAKQKADQYLHDRKAEVEDELMNLVIAVAKKVLPESITYESHKDLVMQALRDVKADQTEA